MPKISIKRVKESKYLYMMLALPILYIIVFKYLPMGGIILAFKDYSFSKGIWNSPWVGFEYFKRFLGDPLFWRAFKNTLKLNIIQILVSFPLPIIFALMLNEVRHNKYKKVVQSISYFPHFVSTAIIIGMVFLFLSNGGVVNTFLHNQGKEKINFLIDPNWFRPIYIITGIWSSVGWSSIIYLAALTSLDMEVIEAAIVDGASRIRRIWSITLPSILPTILIMFIMAVGGILNSSLDKTIMLQTPSNQSTSDLLSMYIYRIGIQGMQFSYSSAIGLFENIVNICFLLGANYITKKVGEVSIF